MDILPEGNWIVDCPHSLQKYVGCNDETAKKLAGLVYEFATDFKLRNALREDERNVTATDTFTRFLSVIAAYDIYAQPFFEGIVLHRYERPPFPSEVKDSDKLLAYLRDSSYDTVRIPLTVADIIRAFGEFAGKEVDPDVIVNCLGFYDDPACDCPVCGKSWERTWDE